MNDMTAGMLAGLAGGLAGAWVMNRFQEATAGPPGRHEVPGAAPGIHREGRGPQPAQAEYHAQDDATARLGDMASAAVLGRRLDERERVHAGALVHFAFGAATGATYGCMAERWPGVAGGAGLPFGMAVWALADQGLVPALGLKPGPRRQPRPLLAYSALSHLLFGATLECVRRMARRGWRG